jgi:hypothetical protein
MLSHAEPWMEALDGIARAVSILVSTRDDHLAAVTVAGPPGLLGPGIEHQLQERLAEFGLDFVEVRTVPAATGPLRLVSTEFDLW